MRSYSCTMELNDRIKAARTEKGMTQEELATEVGKTRGAVAQWESGEVRPRHSTLYDIAEALGRSITWLQTGEHSSDNIYMPKPWLDDFAHRINSQMKELGVTTEQLSAVTKIPINELTEIRSGLHTRITIENIQSIQRTLSFDFIGEWRQKTDAADIGNRQGSQGETHPPNAVLTGPVQFPEKKLPVYGRAIGGVDGEFQWNGEVFAEVLCPPTLSNVSDAYAVYVSGDSMAPRYEEGETIYVNPERAARRGDYVVARVINDEHSTPHAYIKRLVRQNTAELVLEQFNPPKEMKFSMEHVQSIHVIVFSGEG